VNQALVLTISLIILLSSGSTESALRCGTHLVAPGATPGDVESACGAPTHASTSTVILRSAKGAPISVEQTIWVYDYGSLRFTRSLVFESGSLRAIYVGDYGGGDADAPP
jgi:hypothetical protein